MFSLLPRFFAPVDPREVEACREECKSSIRMLKYLHQELDKLIATNGNKRQLIAEIRKIAYDRGETVPEEIIDRIKQL